MPISADPDDNLTELASLYIPFTPEGERQDPGETVTTMIRTPTMFPGPGDEHGTSSLQQAANILTLFSETVQKLSLTQQSEIAGALGVDVATDVPSFLGKVSAYIAALEKRDDFLLATLSGAMKYAK